MGEWGHADLPGGQHAISDCVSTGHEPIRALRGALADAAQVGGGGGGERVDAMGEEVRG